MIEHLPNHWVKCITGSFVTIRVPPTTIAGGPNNRNTAKRMYSILHYSNKRYIISSKAHILLYENCYACFYNSFSSTPFLCLPTGCATGYSTVWWYWVLRQTGCRQKQAPRQRAACF